MTKAYCCGTEVRVLEYHIVRDMEYVRLYVPEESWTIDVPVSCVDIELVGA